MRDRTAANEDDQSRLAVLIDADNAQPAVIDGLLAEVAKYGVASVKRIYGDFTSNQQMQWKKALLKQSIQPIQQFAYTTGKNATDSSLIIDAMDLLYTGRFHGFCLVSSDSDFTRLAQRLREGGMTVYGFGEKKTPDPFVQACDKFLYTEVLRGGGAGADARGYLRNEDGAGCSCQGRAGHCLARKAGRGIKAPLRPVPARDRGSVGRRGLGTPRCDGFVPNKIRPDFDPRLYGRRKLSDLLRQYPKQFELTNRGAPGYAQNLYVRSID